MEKIYFIICVAALAVGCQKMTDEKPLAPVYEEGVMRFEMSHPATKATADAFEEGDKIGLYVISYTDAPTPLQISGNWANNVAATLTAGDWATAKKIYWPEGKSDVYAYYPYMTIASVDQQPFSVALDQNAGGDGDVLGGYEASDFLWTKSAGLTQSETPVALAFEHRLTKFVIQLVKGADYEGEFPDESELYIHNVVPTATIDFATGSVTKDMFGEPATIRARKVDNDTFEAIIVPQRVESRRPFIELISNGVSYLVEDTFNFKAGMQHTVSLTINSNPDQVSVEIGGQIKDWTNSEE